MANERAKFLLGNLVKHLSGFFEESELKEPLQTNGFTNEEVEEYSHLF
jgi:hypothetical protein